MAGGGENASAENLGGTALARSEKTASDTATEERESFRNARETWNSKSWQRNMVLQERHKNSDRKRVHTLSNDALTASLSPTVSAALRPVHSCLLAPSAAVGRPRHLGSSPVSEYFLGRENVHPPPPSCKSITSKIMDLRLEKRPNHHEVRQGSRANPRGRGNSR